LFPRIEAGGGVVAQQGGAGTARERVRQLAESVVAEPARTWDFRREAQRCGTFYHHLRRLFRMETGCGPTDYLLDCRLREAAARLRGGNYSVKEAAYASGFPDAHSLARMMRRRMSITPSELRSVSSQDGRAAAFRRKH
jgi:transcriptional regulator GlxA family with amidase domain